MIAYKVVIWSEKDQCYESCFACGRYICKYIEGEITKAEYGTYLLCFKRRKDAIKFIAYTQRNLTIFKIESVGRKITPRIYTSNYIEEYLDIYYDKLQNTSRLYDYHTNPPHEGTVCYSAVKVLGISKYSE